MRITTFALTGLSIFAAALCSAQTDQDESDNDQVNSDDSAELTDSVPQRTVSMDELIAAIPYGVRPASDSDSEHSDSEAEEFEEAEETEAPDP